MKWTIVLLALASFTGDTARVKKEGKDAVEEQATKGAPAADPETSKNGVDAKLAHRNRADSAAKSQKQERAEALQKKRMVNPPEDLQRLITPLPAFDVTEESADTKFVMESVTRIMETKEAIAKADAASGEAIAKADAASGMWPLNAADDAIAELARSWTKKEGAERAAANGGEPCKKITGQTCSPDVGVLCTEVTGSVCGGRWVSGVGQCVCPSDQCFEASGLPPRSFGEKRAPGAEGTCKAAAPSLPVTVDAPTTQLKQCWSLWPDFRTRAESVAASPPTTWQAGSCCRWNGGTSNFRSSGSLTAGSSEVSSEQECFTWCEKNNHELRNNCCWYKESMNVCKVMWSVGPFLDSRDCADTSAACVN